MMSFEFLFQVGVLASGQEFPIWIRNNIQLRLRVTSTSPAPLVRLVPGTELAVAPKQRKLKYMAASQEASSEAQLSKTVKPAWLRVQELDSQLLRHLQFRSLTVSSKPTTAVYISAATAKLTGLTDGLLVTVVSKEGDTHSQSGEALGTAARGEHGDSHGAASGLHEALLGDGGKKGGGNEFERRVHVVPASKVVVRVRLDDRVARGHVMVAAPLLSQLGVTPFSREFCRLKSVAIKACFQRSGGLNEEYLEGGGIPALPVQEDCDATDLQLVNYFAHMEQETASTHSEKYLYSNLVLPIDARASHLHEQHWKYCFWSLA